MRGAWLVIVLGTAGCDRVFQLDTIAGVDANQLATTITFGETGTATYAGVTADTYVSHVTPTLGYGASNKLYIEKGPDPQVALIRFDVTAIPSEAQILTASLRLSTAVEPSAAPIVATRMLEAWDEGELDGVAGLPNWTERRAGESWSAAGVAPPSRDTVALGSVVPSSNDSSYDLELDAAVVAGWVADPSSNFGLALVTDSTDAVAFRSRSVPVGSDRPLLTVSIVAP